MRIGNLNEYLELVFGHLDVRKLKLSLSIDHLKLSKEIWKLKLEPYSDT